MPGSAVVHDKAELYDDTFAERNHPFAARVGPFLLLERLSGMAEHLELVSVEGRRRRQATVVWLPVLCIGCGYSGQRRPAKSGPDVI